MTVSNISVQQKTPLHCFKFHYFFNIGITGATIKIDANGDSEGNFSVLALKPSRTENSPCNFQMVPVAYFQQGDNPVSELTFFHYVSLLHNRIENTHRIIRPVEGGIIFQNSNSYICFYYTSILCMYVY